MPNENDLVLIRATGVPCPFPAPSRTKEVRKYIRQVGSEPVEVVWSNYWDRRLLKKEIELVSLAPKKSKEKDKENTR